MNQVTWVDVVDEATGRVYGDAAAASRATGLPEKVVKLLAENELDYAGHSFRYVKRTGWASSRSGLRPARSESPGAVRKRRQREREAAEKEPRPPLDDDMRATAVRAVRAGATLAETGRAIGRRVTRRDIERWAARPGMDAPDNGGNAACGPESAPEGAEGGDNLPA